MKLLEGDFLSILLLLLALIVILQFPGEDRRMLHPMTSNLAVQPDHLIVKANDYLTHDEKKACIAYVEKAIESMRLIERDADPESNKVIEAAIHDLKELESELVEEIDRDRISHAFLNALNSLALAQLRESEEYILQRNYAASKVAMQYATKHIECATRFSNKSELVKENELQYSINRIALNESLPNESSIAQLDASISEVDALVLH